MTMQTFMKRAGVMGAAALLSLQVAAAQEPAQSLDGGAPAPRAAKTDAAPAGGKNDSAKSDSAKATAAEKPTKDDAKRARNGKEKKATATTPPAAAGSSASEPTKANVPATADAAASKQSATSAATTELPTAPGAAPVQSTALSATGPASSSSAPATPAPAASPNPNVDLRRSRAAGLQPASPDDPRINFGAGRRGPHGDTLAAAGPKPLWNVAFNFGAERSDEKYIDDTAIVLRFGLEASRVLAENFRVLASFDFRSYKQPYAINTTASNGGASAPTIIGEERYEAAAGAGYDLGPRLLSDGRLALMPTLQLRYMRLQNDAFPTNLFGIEAGARASFELSSAVSAHVRVGYTFNFAQSTTQSGVGAPRALTLWSAGIALPLAGGYALSLDYTGNAITLANVIRLAEGVALGFSYSF